MYGVGITPAPFPHLRGLHILHRTPPETALSDSPSARRKRTQRQHPHGCRRCSSDDTAWGGDIQIPDKLVVDVFVHGWIPGFCDRRGYHYFSDWRECGRAEWEAARWYNGMNCISSTLEEKTIVCGHWHTSYGHCRIEEKCSEFGPDADFSPYIAPGIIAIDACTAHSGIVNCIVIED